MKNVLKKLSFIMVIVLIASTFTPANIINATAASTPSWSNITSSKKTLYVGKKFTIKIKNKPTAKSTYTWSSSDKSIATVTNTGTVTAKKVGKATIKCVIKNSKTKKTTKTLKAAFTIKESATGVSIANPISTVSVGNNVYTFTVNTTTTSGSKTTDKTYWIITDNTAGASVDKNGVLSTTSTGEFKIQAVTATGDTNFALGKYTSFSNVITVNVPLTVTNVQQVSDQKVTVTFNSSVKNIVSAADFSIVNASTYSKQAIKGISYSNDGKSITLETYLNFVDGYTYKLVYGGNEYTFATTNGDVSSIVIKTDKVAYGVASAIDFVLYDSKGIDVTASKKNSNQITVELVDSTRGYIDSDGNITLYAKGDTARVRVTYHTYKYVNGSEVTVVSEGIITAVDQDKVTVGNYEKYTIAKNAPNWNTLTNTVSTIAVNDTGYNIYLLARNSANKVISASDIKYSSSDDNTLLVSNEGALIPLKEGKVYVIATTGSTSWTLPIVITGEKKATSVTVDKSIVTLSNSPIANDIQTVKVTVKDQYGNDYKHDNLKIDSVVETSSKSGAPSAIPYGSKVQFYGAGASKGDYNYVITIEGKKISVTVRVLEPTASASSVYNLELSDTSMNTAITDTTELEDKNITIKVAEYKGGVINSYATLKSLVITQPDKTEVRPSVSGNSYDFKAVSIISGSIVKVASGSYRVVATITTNEGKDISLTRYFTVYDSQSNVTYTVDRLATYKNTIRTAVTDCLTIKDSSGNELTSADIANVYYKSPSTIASLDSKLASGTKIYIDKVIVNVRIGSYLVQQEISVGYTITIQ